MNRPEGILDSELYHVYNRGNNRQPLFIREEDYRFFLVRLAEYSVRWSIRISAFCLLPNHYHLLLSQKAFGDLPKVMGALATSVAKRFNTLYHRSGHVFQGPYQYKRIKEEEYLTHLMRYIHLNPVEAGLTNDPANWKWSDFRFLGRQEEGFLYLGLSSEKGNHLRSVFDPGPLLLSFDGDIPRYFQFVDDFLMEVRSNKPHPRPPQRIPSLPRGGGLSP